MWPSRPSCFALRSGFAEQGRLGLGWRAVRSSGTAEGGLFTPDQFQKATDAAPKEGQLPARGVLEVKGPADDVPKVAASAQVKKYSDKYGLVLVTNYRDFLLLGRDAQGNPLPMEGFTLAATEAVAALLDTEADAPGVTAGKVEAIFRTVGALAKVGGGSLDADAGDLAVTAGWGHRGCRARGESCSARMMRPNWTR